MGKRFHGSSRTVAIAGVLMLALIAPSAAMAKVQAGRLDKSFGKNGKAMIAFPAENPGELGVKYEVPFQFTPGHVQMAAAPGGKVVIAGSTQIARLLANGKLDPSFGDGGLVTVDRPLGRSFLLADVAVDSLGRVLVAGSVIPLPTESTPDPLLSSAMVRRYEGNGSLDTGFGSGGTVITDFGFLPPKIGGGRYSGASVGIRSLVVDNQDRPVVTGGSVSEVVNCFNGGPEHAVNAAFAARLTAVGALDPTFGDNGVRQVGDFGSFAQGHLFPAGNLFAIGAPKFSCDGSGLPRVVLLSLDSGGNRTPGFGFSGFRSVGFAPTAALAPSGKILLLGSKRNAGKHTAQQLIMRLLPDGAIDPGFGRIGRISLIIPRSAGFAAIAADARERLLVAGHVSHKLPRPGPRRATFVLVRIKPKGGVDRSFGRHGSVITGFGGPSGSYATQVLVSGSRILVGGLVSTPRLPTGGGFAIARYIGGR